MPNSFLELYRQSTDDPRSDDEIVLEIGQKRPQYLSEFPELAASYQRLTQKPEMPPYEPSGMDYVRQAAGSYVRNVGGMVASIPEQLAIAASGISLAVGGDIGIGSGDPTKAEERASFQLGQAIRRGADALAPAPVEGLENSFFASKVPGAIGAASAFMVGGAAGKLLKVPQWLGVAGLGSAATGTEFYNDAKSKGADDRTAYLSSLTGNIVGLSEAFPLAKMLNRLDGVTGGSFTKTLVEAGKESFEEALQEASQQFAQNYVAQKLYDKDRELLQDLKEGAGVGGVTGLLFSLITQGIGKHIGRSSGASTPAASPPPIGAGQPSAQAVPAPIPTVPTVPTIPIPEGMKGYTTKNDGSELRDDERVQLEAMARQVKSGTPLTIEQQAAVEATPAYANALTVIQQQMEAEPEAVNTERPTLNAELPATPSPETPAEATDQAIKDGAQGEATSHRVKIESLKDNRGRIGKQGFTADRVIEIINHAAGTSFDVDGSLKDALAALKGNPDALAKVKRFLEQTPIDVAELPDGTTHLKDGHHRAFLADQIGMESLPVKQSPTQPSSAETAAGEQSKAAPEIAAPATPVLETQPDTRGKGVQYHGARGDITSLTEGYYSSDNIYGGEESFYTTDAFDIAKGYGRKKPSAAVYRTQEIKPVKFFSMEDRIAPSEWRSMLSEVWPKDFVSEAIGALQERSKNPPNLREIMDELREESASYGLSKDDLQDVFSGIRDVLEGRGYGGMTHTGGLRTKNAPHLVKIYFQPAKQLSITKVTEPVIEEARAEADSLSPATAVVAAPIPSAPSPATPALEIVAAESNESINARVTVEGRSAEMAKRGAAAKALNQSLKEGDIVTRPDGTVMVVNDVMKDGSVTVTIDGKRHFIEGGLAAEFNGGTGEVSTIQRKGAVKDPAPPESSSATAASVKPVPQPYSKEAVQSAFNLTPEQAEAVDALVKALGLDESRIKVADGGSASERALLQMEDILIGEEKVPQFDRIAEVVKFIRKYASQNTVIPKGIQLASSKGRAAAVDAIVEHTILELAAWKKITKNYIPFYTADILERTNPALQRHALEKYGRKLSAAEIAFVHLLSAFGSGQAEPTVDTITGMRVFDEYMRTGRATGYTDKPKPVFRAPARGEPTVRVFVDAKTGEDTFVAKGNKPKFDATQKAQISKTYNVPGLARFNRVLDHFAGDLDKTIEWLGAQHTFEDIQSVIGAEAAATLKPHEYLNKSGLTFGTFTLGNNPKLGSYILNRWQKLGTITKDMWVARTMSRYFREPNTGKPWVTTVEGNIKRRILDEAWGIVAKRLGVEPAQIQEMMWDAEKQIYARFGQGSLGAYTSQGVEMEIARLNQDGTGAEPKGAVDFIDDGNSVLRGFSAADVSTGLHEFAHVTRRQLLDRSVPAEQRLGISDKDIAAAEAWAGAKDGVWDRPAEEKFARGFERYLRDGKSPTPQLASIFAKFKEWLVVVYRKLAGSGIDVKISPEMRQVFNRLVTRSERLKEPAPPAAKPEYAPPILNADGVESLLTDLDEKLAVEREVAGVTKESSFFEVEPQGFSLELGERLTKNARVQGQSGSTYSVAFFEDKQTGQVVGLGVIKAKNSTQGPSEWYKVGRAPGQKSGTSLKRLLATGRFQPLGAMTLKTPVKYATTAFAFQSRQEFDQFKVRAQDQLDSVRGTASQVESTKTAVESKGEGVEIVQVDESTPDAILAATEGFTPDESGAIWDALDGIKLKMDGGVLSADSRKKLLGAIARDEDAVHALTQAIKVLSEVKGTDGVGGDANLILRIIEEYIYDAQRTHPKSKENFAKSLAEEINRTGSEAAAKSGGSVSGADAGAANGGAEAAAATGGRGEEVRFHSGAVDARYRPAPHQVAAAFRSAVLALANAGYDVNLLQQEAVQATQEFGQIDNAERVVSLVMAEIGDPSTDNLYHLNAEVAHAVFAQLPASEQQRLQDAIRNATDAMLGITTEFQISPAVPTSQREGVQQEERIVDVVARSLTAQGFDAAKSNTLAQRFWRLLRAAILRAGMAFSRAWGVPSPRLAAQYLQVRVEQFLSGQVRPYSFTDFMGGPRVRVQVQNRQHTFGHGYTSVNYRFNTATGQIEVQEALPSSAAAIISNATNATVRYHGPTNRDGKIIGSPDIGPEIHRYDIAANNEVDAGLQAQYAHWTAMGGNLTATGQPAMSYEQFAAWVTKGAIQVPKESLAQAEATISKMGQAPQDLTLRMAGMNPDGRRTVAAKAYGLYSKLRGHWQEMYRKSADELDPNQAGSKQRKFNREALRTQNILTNYTDALYLWGEIKTDVLGWAKWLKINSKRIGKLNHQKGVLEQVIEEAEGTLDEAIADQYESAINKLVNRFANNDSTKVDFVEMLQTLAATGQLWDQMSTGEILFALKNPGKVTTGVFDIATAIPAIRLLTESSIEARALRSVTAAFLKKNRLMTEMLALRASKAFADRAEVNEALKEAMTGTSRSFDALKRGFNQANKLKGRLERILVNLEEKQRDQRKLMDELKQHREWMFFYENASKPLTQQMATLENVLGIVREDFEPVTGEQYLVVSHPNEDPELILQQNHKTKKLYSTERTVAQDKVMDAEVALMNQWLEAHPAGNPLHGGTMYNRLEMQVQKMRENSMGAQVDKGTRSLIQAVVGSVTVKLDATGIPALKQVARQFRKWVTYHELYKQNAQRWGNDWSNAVSQARKILGYNREQLEFFLERFYDPSWNYLERRTDLQAGAATNADAESAALAALKAYHNLPAKEWAALEKLLKASVGVADQYVKAQEEMGLKVEDKRLGVLRKVRGPRWFEMPRKLSSNLDRVYDVMQSKVNAPGPWAKNPLSELEDIDGKGNSLQDLLATDPAALKAIIDPLFAGDIWDLFVAPLVNRSGRSAFLAPADTAGFQRLASTGEVQVAFLAAPKGDVMAFISNLFNAAGGTMDQAAFTEETLKTFNNWFQQIHNLKKEQSNAAGVVMASIDEIMMNSRQLDEFPAEWVRYARFDMHSIRSTMNTMALHGAFGRNLEAAQRLWAEGDKVLEGRENELKNKVLKPLFELPVKGRSKSYLRKATLDLAKAEGLDLEVLERASKDRAMAKNEMQNFQAFVQSQGGVAMEFKWWSQLLSAMVAWTVQGPKTALIDTTSLFKPIQEIGLSTPALRWTMQNIKGTVMQNVGGFMEIFGKTIKWEADRMRMLHEHGATPAADEYSISERIVSLAMANAAGPNAGLFQRATSAVSIAAGTARELLNASIPKAAANPQFVAIKPALFTQMSQTMHLGSILGTWRTYDDLVARAAQWLNNPARVIERRDPSFRFDKSFAEHLGYGPKFFGLLDDAGAFESLLAKLGEQGLTLEGLAKDFINRGLTGNVMTNQAYERLMTIAPTQLMQEASIVSRPSWMITNPIAHVALPLVGWSIAQTAGLAKLFRKDGSGEYAGIKRGLLKFVPVMGVGLAYAMLADWYDEEVLKKKSNRLTFTGDNAAAALVDKAALTGLLGLAGDFANSVVNVSTAREFTIDSRVFAISSFQGIWRALATWYHQGDATYATVYRPLMQSMGGSGALQYLQVVNGLLGADNPESRATARINVGNWMRVVGRDAGMEVKTTRGSGDYVPARTTPWVRQMALAAIANDPDEFRSAHREAVAAAREDKRENPESYVKQAYQAQHPLRSTFKVIPTVTEYQKLLMQMPENGRRDVSEAVRLLNIYGERIGIDPYFGREPKQENFVRDLLRDMKKGRDEILKRDAFKLAF